jgi:hypothetical protein
MIKDLMNLANSLDSKGLTKEADVLDLLIKKIAQQDDINLEDLDVDYEPYGHYEFDYRDEENWPHFKLMNNLPHLSHSEQQHLIKEAMLDYFIQNGYYSEESVIN